MPVHRNDLARLEEALRGVHVILREHMLNYRPDRDLVRVPFGQMEEIQRSLSYAVHTIRAAQRPRQGVRGLSPAQLGLLRELAEMAAEWGHISKSEAAQLLDSVREIPREEGARDDVPFNGIRADMVFYDEASEISPVRWDAAPTRMFRPSQTGPMTNRVRLPPLGDLAREVVREVVRPGNPARTAAQVMADHLDDRVMAVAMGQPLPPVGGLAPMTQTTASTAPAAPPLTHENITQMIVEMQRVLAEPQPPASLAAQIDAEIDAEIERRRRERQ